MFTIFLLGVIIGVVLTKILYTILYYKDHSEYRNQKQTVLTRCKYDVLESKDRDEKIAEIE